MNRLQRPFKKRPDQMGSLISGALQRHGIGRQVQAAMIVKYANELLDQFVEERHRRDVRTISFQQSDLHVACRHAPARHVIESIRISLSERLEQQFPSISIERIVCRIDPHALDSTSEIL